MTEKSFDHQLKTYTPVENLHASWKLTRQIGLDVSISFFDGRQNGTDCSFEDQKAFDLKKEYIDEETFDTLLSE